MPIMDRGAPKVMAEVNKPNLPLPNFRTARLVGIFNVVFATEILFCGICMSGYIAMIPMWAGLMNRVQKSALEQGERARKGELQVLDEQEAAATTVEEKALVKARREELEKRPPSALPASMDFNKMGLTDPVSVTWSWAEVLSGIVVNVLMLISGIGLLRWRGWARSLGIWTAVLKIVRLVLIYGAFIALIVPPLARNMGEMVIQMSAQQPGMMPAGKGGMPPVALFVRVYTVMYSVMGVGVIVLGVIYPLVVLWLLTRPGVKSACSGAFRLPREPNQPC
jgi:hypothetical protein